MIAFEVDDVAPVVEPKPRVALSLESMLDATVLASSPMDGCVARADVRDLVAMNGLVMAVHLAFAEHRPLRLSPDDVWLVILQGFAIHVSKDAEVLRQRFVDFAGQRRLTVDLEQGQSWADAFRLFREGLARELNPGLVSALTGRFSTTTSVHHDAFVIASMSAFARYFDYEMTSVCGIPSVTLTGTADDWRAVRARFRVLAEYDLQWWARRLDPVLDELVATAEGRPNRPFWQAIIKPKRVYGGEVLTGWLPRLFPYLQRTGQVFERNEAATNGWEHAPVRPSELPRGLSSATIRAYPDALVTAVSGFFGVTQAADGGLAPLIGWAIARKATDTLFTELATRLKTSPPVDNGSWLHARWCGVSGLLQAFSARFGACEGFDGRLMLHAPPTAPVEFRERPGLLLDLRERNGVTVASESGLVFGALDDGALLVRTSHFDVERRQMAELILRLDGPDAKPPYRVVAHSLLEFYQRLATATSLPPWDETWWSPR